MSSFRPSDWPKDPCENCERKVVDDYGYLCDLSCGNYSAGRNFEAGADLMLEKLMIEEALRKIAEPWPGTTPKGFLIDCKEDKMKVEINCTYEKTCLSLGSLCYECENNQERKDYYKKESKDKKCT